MFHTTELARLAGTTARTLRHYHQLGLLPEPARTAGGYREYGIPHLLRLLRIRRLAALGLPLQRIGPLLDAAAEEGPDALDELDAELGRRIEELTEQRRLLAAARATGDLELPEVLGPHAGALRGAGLPETAVTFERESALLLGRLLGPAGEATLRSLYDATAALDLQEQSFALVRRLYELDDDPGREDRLVDDFTEFARSLLGDLDEAVPSAADPRAEQVLAEFLRGSLSPAQERVLRRVGEALDAG